MKTIIIYLTIETNISPKLTFFWKRVKICIQFRTKWPKDIQTMKSEETHKTIEFNQVFEISPHQTIEAIGTLDFIENMTIPFTAKLVVSGSYFGDSLKAKEIAV